jgi:hypothetical protein
MQSQVKGDIADPILYRTYWSLMMSDILHGLGMDATKANKEEMHELHKKVLGYESIAGKPQEIVSLFIFEVAVYHAVEHGIFVRTNRKQPLGIEHMKLHDVWHLL